MNRTSSKRTLLASEILSTRTLARTFHELLDLGPRLMGSPGELAAQDFLARRLASWGLACERQEFAVPSWRRGPARVVLKARSGDLNLACLAFAYSAATEGPELLDVEPVGQGNQEDLDRAACALPGKAAYCRPQDVMRSRKYRSLARLGARACVFGSHVDHHDGCVISYALDGDRSPAPVVGLSRSATAILEEHLPGCRLEVDVRGRLLEATSGNLVATLEGRSNRPAIVVGAHLDTFDIAPGALDNSAGVALVAETARVLARLPAPLRTVRFVFFTGEEVHCTGSRRFVTERVSGPGDAALYFNVDMPAEGGVPGLLTTGLSMEPGFWESLRRDAARAFPVAEAEERYSDHAPFAERGIPCLWTRAFVPGSLGPANFEHTELDQVDLVDQDELREAAHLTAVVLHHLANCEPMPFTRRF